MLALDHDICNTQIQYYLERFVWINPFAHWKCQKSAQTHTHNWCCVERRIQMVLPFIFTRIFGMMVPITRLNRATQVYWQIMWILFRYTTHCLNSICGVLSVCIVHHVWHQFTWPKMIRISNQSHKIISSLSPRFSWTEIRWQHTHTLAVSLKQNW